MNFEKFLNICAVVCGFIGAQQSLATTAAMVTEKTIPAVTLDSGSSGLRSADTAASTLVATNPAPAANANVVPPPALPQEPTANIPNTISNALAPADATTTSPASTIPGITTNTLGGTATGTQIAPKNPTATTTTPAVESSTSTAASQPFSLEETTPFQPWQAGTMISLFLAAFALAGYSLVRVKNKSSNKANKPEKPMEIISSMPIGPKRQLMIVRIRNQEIVIASTESGVTMLSEVAKEQPPKTMLADMRPLTQLARTSIAATHTASDSKETGYNYSESSAENDTPTTRKSDILSKALNSLKEKKNAPKSSDNEKSTKNTEPSPALSGNAPGFTKFFANAFEQESKRNVSKQRTESQESADDSVENVSKLIRERLKNMQSAGH